MSFDTSSNDNGEGHRPFGPDPHGHAAILLVESLVHGLIARNVITVADAVEIVDVAAEVKADLGIEAFDQPAGLRESLEVLNAISSSLRRDLASD